MVIRMMFHSTFIFITFRNLMHQYNENTQPVL